MIVSFFLMHAARQSGKTTAVQGIVEYVNESKTHCALYGSLETVDSIHDETDAIRAIAALILRRPSSAAIISMRDDEIDQFTREGNPTYTIRKPLGFLASSTSKSLVFLLDEADCVKEEALIPLICGGGTVYSLYGLLATRRQEASGWAGRLTWEDVDVNGKIVHVVGF